TAHPYAAHVWTYSPERGLTFRSQPYRLHEADFRAEADDLSKMVEGWMKIGYDSFSKEMAMMQKKGKDYYFEANWAPRGEKHAYQSVAYFLQRDEHTGALAISGMAFDAEYLRQHLLPELLDQMIVNNVAGGQSDTNHA